MIAARELAVDLSQFPVAQRERLLSGLPPERRTEMERLLQEIAGVLSEPASRFEQHLALAETAPALRSCAGLNDGQLRLLLCAEPVAVQRRISGAVRSGQLADFPAAVGRIVSEHLARRVQSNEIGRGEAAGMPSRWWRKWQRVRR